MNVRLLRKIQKHILTEPRRLIMRIFVAHAETYGPTYEGDSGHAVRFPTCKTAACISGWACLLTKQKRIKAYWARGRRILDLSEGQAIRLFIDTQWPQPFSDQYGNATTPRMRARIAVRRIDHFIKTKGAE
jgi:hypothetical protein